MSDTSIKTKWAASGRGLLFGVGIVFFVYGASLIWLGFTENSARDGLIGAALLVLSSYQMWSSVQGMARIRRREPADEMA